MIDNLDGGINKAMVDCVCPHCNEVYKKLVDIAHINSPDAWRRDGRLVVFCGTCRPYSGVRGGRL